MSESVPVAGLVTDVAEGSQAASLLRPGDRVVSVDGALVRDIVDWWWLTDGPSFTVRLVRGGETLDVTLEREPGQPLGVSFAEPVFDGVRECDNACAFCFVSQLPKGLRRSLYVRDDDFRLSFLNGNFVTFTNLDDRDVDRIVEQRLSPLHVSIHAVNEEVRSSLVCPTVDDRALDIVDTLLAAGIEIHVQIVLVPEVNDGDVLDETLSWLAVRPGVLSVGVVPMGFTAHQRRFVSSFDTRRSAAVIAALTPWQARMRAERDANWVYAADEFYLNACVEVPLAEEYDGFPQYENGIGLVRAFRDEFSASPGRGDPDVTVVTGTMFAPVLEEILRADGRERVRVLAVANRLFGGNVAVTGLLSGRDIMDAVMGDAHGGTYLVPDVVVNSDGLLLDDVPACELARRSGRDVRIVGSDGARFRAALNDPSESQADAE